MRPIDCRLFPLDVRFISGRYFWAYFRYHKCFEKPTLDFDRLLAFRTQALQFLAPELKDYATLSVPGMEKMCYFVFAPVGCEDGGAKLY